MPLYTRESLETLKTRIDLVEVIQPYVDLKRSGAVFKGLCPFHDEKTPSFSIQKGDKHYHCFGCSAHGDAIQFMMSYLSQSFSDAVETLAEKFHVHLDRVEGARVEKGPSKSLQKQGLDWASRFYHFYLLHTSEGHQALEYLFERGITIDFIRRFQVGLAPSTGGVFRKVMHEKGLDDEALEAAGLIKSGTGGRFRDFFIDRITFPIHNPAGSVIGFSARKYKDDTFGGKYVNTSETPLFKKSRILFGLNYCRRRIAKEQRVIIVEGQIDALRLIYEGFDFAVAGQGTAFGEGHVQELLTLGVSVVYLALDSDEAGLEAASKIGNLFQKEGIDVRVVPMPAGSDPDSYLREQGPQNFLNLLEKSDEYLDFLINFQSRAINRQTPAGKTSLINTVSNIISKWKEPVMVHESLRKLASIMSVPEHMVTLSSHYTPNLHISKTASVGFKEINPNRILESDLLRWILNCGGGDPFYLDIARKNIDNDFFIDPVCQRIYEAYRAIIDEGGVPDTLSLITEEEDQTLIEEMMKKKIDDVRAKEHYLTTLQKILERNWMAKREEVTKELDKGGQSDEQQMALLKRFDELKAKSPEIIIHEVV